MFNRSLRWQNVLILIASYFFYGWWSIQFLSLLFLSTLLDYFYGFSVASINKKKSKLFLWLSIINNLGILGVFKYYNFFALQFQKGFEEFGIHTNPIFLSIALPIGISFYTFHGMSYVFDIYNGKQKPVSNFIDYAVFVSFFPLLVAGPIERASHLLPQVQRKRKFDYTQTIQGYRLILWGLFKKVVIADNLALIVDPIFNNYADKSGLTLIVGAIGFSFQIYCDFSGYSDIAMGAAKLFGFELLSNFKFPYFSRDIAEFWRRWHISLSSWFRDYLYIPLGGSRNGKINAIRNTFLIFIISGFWHGANWNFIIWGFIHACCFLPLLLSNKNRQNIEIVAANKMLPSFKESFQILLTFIIVTIAWVFFRLTDIRYAFLFLKNIFISVFIHPKLFINFSDKASIFNYVLTFIFIAPLLLIDWWLRRDERKIKVPENMILRRLIYLVFFVIVIISILSSQIAATNKSFIYFQF